MYSITQKYDPNYPKSFFLYIWDMGFMIDDILGQRTKKREVIFSSYISLFPECLSDVITFSILIPKTISEVVTWGAKCDHNIKFSSWLSFTYVWHLICRVSTEKIYYLHKVWRCMLILSNEKYNLKEKENQTLKCISWTIFYHFAIEFFERNLKIIDNDQAHQ